VCHRTIRCTSGATAPSRNGRLQKLENQMNNEEQCVQSKRRPLEAHRTVNSSCPVRHRTVRCGTELSGATKRQSLQRQKLPNPNGWVTWLAHRTVFGGAPDCPVRPSTATLPIGCLVVAPNHLHSNHPSIPHIAFNTRAIDFTPRHKSKRSIHSKSQIQL
jgi:hypothetical protein